MSPAESHAAELALPEAAAQPPVVAVLGAGPAGATAALVLARDKGMRVLAIERGAAAGGNAGSFELEGVWCDHGSHRFHPVAEPRVMAEVEGLLGDDLLWRPRHGRILLQGAWIHFPLKPLDLVLRLPKKFAASLALDTMRKLLPRPAPREENFATVLEHGLGRAMSDSFYYPYVRKLWGVPPSELAVTLAKRRVSGSSVGKILAKVARQIPGLGLRTAGGFYYPSEGFGLISRRLAEAATSHGAELVFGAEVTGLDHVESRVAGVSYRQGDKTCRLTTSRVWSTLPITALVRMMTPTPPAEVLAAADAIRFRGMILIYLVLEQQQFTEYDAHYFPEPRIPISRLSEPKNYAGRLEPRGRTVLCAELPSNPDESAWQLSNEELGQQLCDWLGMVGLPVKSRVRETVTRRLRHAYPVYDRDYERHLAVMSQWIDGIDGLLTFGRQGLFAHDNTHHTMTMALAAGDCLQADGGFDRERWAGYKREFEAHVVED